MNSPLGCPECVSVLKEVIVIRERDFSQIGEDRAYRHAMNRWGAQPWRANNLQEWINKIGPEWIIEYWNAAEESDSES